MVNNETTGIYADGGQQAVYSKAISMFNKTAYTLTPSARRR
jgi:hypothetical protein